VKGVNFQLIIFFQICLDNEYSLLFKLHGNRSNILLTWQNKIRELFKSRLKKDYELEIDSLHRNVNDSRQQFDLHDGEFWKINPAFGPVVKNYLASIDYEKKNPDEKWKAYQELMTKLSAQDFYSIQNDLPVFSLLPFSNFEFLGKDPIQAINRYFIDYTSKKNLARDRKRMLSKLMDRAGKAEKYIRNAKTNLDKLRKQTSYREIGDLLMANMHAISGHQKEVELFNFYSNENIRIRLNPELSPQKNAENYYRKSKNQHRQVEKLQQNLEKKSGELLRLNEWINQIRDARSKIEIRKIQSESGMESKTGTKQKIVPYREFHVGEFRVWVGKSAKANDELTLKYSFKEDLWLHARNVTGSHVLIKYQSGKDFPQSVKEKAASLAAWYSKGRNDSLFPVICTPKKYVRKPKSLPPGAVLVDKELEVLMVEPSPDPR
jgi:predicted ribosome quality control (RQC) complex YloA/Tae2 family protein